MSFTTEEEWQAAYRAAEDVIRLKIDCGGVPSMSGEDIVSLSRDVATAVIRSQHDVLHPTEDVSDVLLVEQVSSNRLEMSNPSDPLLDGQYKRSQWFA